MIFSYSLIILAMFLTTSTIGYILVVLKEKINLRKNMIVIDKKSLTQESIDENEVKEFVLSGIQIRSGDEVKVVLNGDVKLQGIIIGAKRREDSIALITHNEQIKKFHISKVKRFRVIARYGKFFNAF